MLTPKSSTMHHLHYALANNVIVLTVVQWRKLEEPVRFSKVPQGADEPRVGLLPRSEPIWSLPSCRGAGVLWDEDGPPSVT